MEHTYHAQITWTGNSGTGTSNYKSYERSHEIVINGKRVLDCSSDPAFRGDAALHNPEDLFLSAIASCHMLWYLHLCADKGVRVLSYTDYATGTLTLAADGSGRFTYILLQPRVRVDRSETEIPAAELHEYAHRMCFLANSVSVPIQIEPIITSEITT